MNEWLNMHGPRRRLSLAVVLLLAASLLAQAVLGWPASTPRTIHAQRSAAVVAPQPTVTLQPSSGPVGTTVSISATGFPRQADLSKGATLSFDTTPVAGEQAPIVPCTAISVGFGPACNANSPALTYTIPPNTAPGIHTFVATATSDAGTFTSSPAPFTVLPAASLTGTATSTAAISPTATANTPTVTATVTSTPAVAPGTSTATASSTATQTPVAPTATATSASPSPTPTARKVVRPQAIVLIKAAFSAGAVAVVVHTAAYGHVSIDFQVVAPNAQGHQQQRYDLKKGGTADSLGVFTIRMGIAYHKPGTAVITVTLSGSGSTQIVRRSYRYGVT
jgi:hypothetical protein